MLDQSTTEFQDIGALAVPTQMEEARQGFVRTLRKFVMVDLSKEMREDYEQAAKPTYVAAKGAEPATPVDVQSVMQDRLSYRMWSSLRYNAQEMVWASVQNSVERVLPDMIGVAKDAAKHNPAGGSLKLNPNIEIPHYVSELDVHLMPGCFHVEHTQDDVAQGAVLSCGGDVFRGGFKHRKGNPGGVGYSIAQYLKHAHPEFTPKRILDLGCTSGKNLMPYKMVFPDADVHGIDVGAPMLRFGHALASHENLPIHFSQQNAENLDFEDNSFDIVTSSFFLHELPVSSTKAIFAEARRVLKPGGIMVHMELPPNSEVDAYYGFYLDWDTGPNNNEPYYADFRNQDMPALCKEAGFDADKYLQKLIPNYSSFGEENFAAYCRGDKEGPQHGNGAAWFIFGSWV